MSTPLTPRQEETVNAIADHYKEIIKLLGEDPDREGLLKTPMRAARALFRVTCGYDESGQQVIEKAIFTHEGSRMVIVKDIEFYSFCEHHILPFFGHVSIGYIPDGKIVGLSKLARLVNVYARRLQVQERMTAEICRDLQRHLAPKGVIVVSTAQHLCMKLRGVEKQDSSTTTMETSGVFDDDYRLREEFLRSLAHN